MVNCLFFGICLRKVEALKKKNIENSFKWPKQEQLSQFYVGFHHWKPTTTTTKKIQFCEHNFWLLLLLVDFLLFVVALCYVTYMPNVDRKAKQQQQKNRAVSCRRIEEENGRNSWKRFSDLNKIKKKSKNWLSENLYLEFFATPKI